MRLHRLCSAIRMQRALVCFTLVCRFLIVSEIMGENRPATLQTFFIRGEEGAVSDFYVLLGFIGWKLIKVF